MLSRILPSRSAVQYIFVPQRYQSDIVCSGEHEADQYRFSITAIDLSIGQ